MVYKVHLPHQMSLYLDNDVLRDPFLAILPTLCGILKQDKKQMNRKLIFLIITFLTLNSFGQTSMKERSVSTVKREPIIYNIVSSKYIYTSSGEIGGRWPGETDTTIIEILPESIKALAAFYSAMGGNFCGNETLDLTTALGLGKQGSDKHKRLIKTYFPNDKVAEIILKQNYLRPIELSAFSEYDFLTITDFGDTVKVDYNIWNHENGNEVYIMWNDLYLFKDDKFFKIERHLWDYKDK